MGWRRRGCVASMLGIAAGDVDWMWALLERAVGWRRWLLCGPSGGALPGRWPVGGGDLEGISSGVWSLVASLREVVVLTVRAVVAPLLKLRWF